jgi:hypothetical protein
LPGERTVEAARERAVREERVADVAVEGGFRDEALRVRDGGDGFGADRERADAGDDAGWKGRA